jgi:DNA repair protein SbcD/Mre11
VRIFHAADLHIDSPLGGLVRYPGAPVERVRGATRGAFRHLVDACLGEHADVLMLAGDVFDREWRDFNTGLFFLQQLNRLRETNTKVLMVRGNHDARNVVTRGLRYPDHVFEFPSDRAVTHVVGDVAFHGQSFADAKVDVDLAATYPAAIRGALNVGLLHTSLDGRPGHDSYAPTRASVLRDAGYDYWALGHVHAREIVATEPWIVYPGNLQGRHIRESGAKGATSFRIHQGRIADVAAMELDVLRFHTVTLTLADGASLDDAIDRGRDALAALRSDDESRILAVRIVLSGTESALLAATRAQEKLTEELRGAALTLHDVWVEKVELRPLVGGATTRTTSFGGLAHIAEDETLTLGKTLANGVAEELPEAVRDVLEEEDLLSAAVHELRAELVSEEA